jgi:hypothetical protein
VAFIVKHKCEWAACLIKFSPNTLSKNQAEIRNVVEYTYRDSIKLKILKFVFNASNL